MINILRNSRRPDAGADVITSLKKFWKFDFFILNSLHQILRLNSTKKRLLWSSLARSNKKGGQRSPRLFRMLNRTVVNATYYQRLTKLGVTQWHPHKIMKQSRTF